MPPNFRRISIPGFKRVEVWDQLETTMEAARQVGATLVGDEAGLIVALRQTAGRGRQGREWNDALGNFSGTFVLPVLDPSVSLSGFSLAVGVALCEALAAFGFSLQLKWPNDLVVWVEDRLRKVGGVLIEVAETKASSGSKQLLVGVGINVSTSPAHLPNAISLSELADKGFDFDQLMVGISTGIKSMHQRFFREGGFSAVRKEWMELSCFDQHLLTLSDTGSRLASDVGGQDLLKGKYLGVSEDGALELESPDGKVAIISGHLLSWEKQ